MDGPYVFQNFYKNSTSFKIHKIFSIKQSITILFYEKQRTNPQKLNKIKLNHVVRKHFEIQK